MSWHALASLTPFSLVSSVKDAFPKPSNPLKLEMRRWAIAMTFSPCIPVRSRIASRSALFNDWGP